jgi:parallel beta-helix repeat protein
MAIQKYVVVKPTYLPRVILTLCAVASLAASVPVSAATLTVDDNYPTETAKKFKTIQAAILAAAPGDKIKVFPGAYSGPILVNKSVDILGAGAGSTPSGIQTDPSVYSVVQHNGGSAFEIAAGVNAVTISGFTIQGNPASSDYPNAGIFVFKGVNRTLTDNVLTGNGLGIYVNGDQTGLMIKTSAFVNNLRTPNPYEIPAGGIFTVDGLMNDSAIQKNYFTGNAQFSVNIGGGSSQGLNIVNNEAVNESTFVVIGKTQYARIVNNNVSNLIYSGIYCYGNNDNLLISQNTLVGGTTDTSGSGIRVTLTAGYGGTTGDTNTSIKNNVISDFAFDGITLNQATGATVVNNTLQVNGQDGIRLQASFGSTIQNNDSLLNARYGISIGVPSTGNTIKKNGVYNNVVFDAFDATAIGANAWIKNDGVTQNRPDLLQ